MKKIILFILLTSILTLMIFGQSWFSDMGTFSWDFANRQCNQKGMRLTNISELEYSFSSGKTKRWNDTFI